MKDVEGIDKVIKDLSSIYYPKFKGAKFVVDYGVILLEQGKKISLEINDLSNDLRRIYDIVVEEIVDGQQFLTRLELKNWTQFHPSTIKVQFVKDLVKMNNLGEIKWLFNKTDNIPDLDILKNNVLSSLKKADGSPLDELEILFDESGVFSNRMTTIFGSEINNADDLLGALTNEGNFTKIFEIIN